MPMLTAKEEGNQFRPPENSNGVRVVDFESFEDVANAIRKLDGVELKGKKVRLSEDAVRPPASLVKEHELTCILERDD